MKITLKNTKQINSLELNLPTKSGVYIFCGANGVGKTTLFHAISFLFKKNALRDAFKPGTNGFDSFANASITYSHGGVNINYNFNNSNWAPSQKNVSFKPHALYSKGEFLKVDHTRVVPKDDLLKNSTRIQCAFSGDVATILKNPKLVVLQQLLFKEGEKRLFAANTQKSTSAAVNLP